MEFSVSRLVVDPERLPDDASESMSAKGMGAVYTRTSDGAPLRSQGFSAEVNRPFAGTLVPSEYYERDARVWSVMIEINRSLYMDEQTAQKRAGFGEFASQMRETLDRLINRASAR